MAPTGAVSVPVVCRHAAVDSHARAAWLEATGRLLTRWPAEPFESAATDCYQVGDDFWIWQPGVGGIRFSAAHAEVAAFPDAAVDLTWFDHLITRSWLPAVYQTWGRQVLHASASVNTADGFVAAFSGPSGAGKSTLAYALATRAGWRQIADDTLAFAIEGGALRLHPLANDVRLRPATATYFGRSDTPIASLDWPAEPLIPGVIFCIERLPPDVRPAASRLQPTEAYRRLLEQAHAFTLEVPAHNQRLMRDYLTLTARVPAYRFAYPLDFARLDRVLDAIESVVAEVRTPPARRT